MKFHYNFCSFLCAADWVIITGKLPTPSELISPVAIMGTWGNLRHLEDTIPKSLILQLPKSQDFQCEIAVCNWAIKKEKDPPAARVDM